MCITARFVADGCPIIAFTLDSFSFSLDERKSPQGWWLRYARHEGNWEFETLLEAVLSCTGGEALARRRSCGWVLDAEGPSWDAEPDGFVTFTVEWALHFFHFIRRFWNQIFTCRSVRLSCAAISERLSFVKKWLKWNSFSNSRSCFLVYAVLFLFPSVPLFQPALPSQWWNGSRN